MGFCMKAQSCANGATLGSRYPLEFNPKRVAFLATLIFFGRNPFRVEVGISISPQGRRYAPTLGYLSMPRWGIFAVPFFC